MSDLPLPSPRAFSGFIRRCHNENGRKRARRIAGLDITIRSALTRMKDRPYDLTQIGSKFGFPDDPPGTPRFTIATIRRMYHLGLIRIIGRIGGVFIELTAYGKGRAEVVTWKPSPPGRPGRLPKP